MLLTGDDTSQNIQTEFDQQENYGYGFLRQKRCAYFDFMEQKTIINNKASLLQDSMLPLKSSTKQKKRHAFICLDDAQPICLIVLTNPLVTITFIESWRRMIGQWLGGQRFTNNKELQKAVRTYQSSLAADFFEEGIGKLVSRYDKRLNLLGNYVKNKYEIKNDLVGKFFCFVNVYILYSLSELRRNSPRISSSKIVNP